MTTFPDLITLDTRRTAIHNELFYRDRSYGLPNDSSCKIQFHLLHEKPDATFWAIAASAGETCHIGVIDADWSKDAPVLAEAMNNESTLPDGLLNELASLVFDSWLTVLSDFTGLNWKFQQLVNVPNENKYFQWVKLSFKSANAAGNLALGLTMNQCQKLAETAKLHGQTNDDNLMFPPLIAELIVEQQFLSAKTIASLREGDIIVLDFKPDLSLCPLQLYLPGYRLNVLHLENENRFRVITIMSDSNNEDISTDSLEELQESSINNIVVPVKFVLGQIELEIDEIKALKPGYVFNGPEINHQQISITVQGRKIGRGELVNLDGQVGVRITSLLEK